VEVVEENSGSSSSSSKSIESWYFARWLELFDWDATAAAEAAAALLVALLLASTALRMESGGWTVAIGTQTTARGER
jgi:hypothetical protein